MNLLLLGVLWIVWCTMHSLLIARPVTGYLQRLLGGGFRYYRLFYNLTAILSLMPLLLLLLRLPPSPTHQPSVRRGDHAV